MYIYIYICYIYRKREKGKTKNNNIKMEYQKIVNLLGNTQNQKQTKEIKR